MHAAVPRRPSAPAMARALHERRRMHPTAWHDARRKQLLAAHPEARHLAGHNPWTAALTVALVALQLSLAFTASRLPWWAVPLLAYAAGAFVAHALGVVIHECAHELVFARAPWNRALSLLANVPLVMPGAIDFRSKHLAHHRHLGTPEDTQAPPPSDVRFVTSPLRAAIWHSFAPLYGTAQTVERDAWLVLNAGIQLATLAPFTWAAGPQALAFLVLSGWLAFGPHPAGVRRYGEHLALAPNQPTASYYGPVNALSLDVGYHVEHHDLPSVPWNRLRALHALAPELYRPLETHRSWSRLLWRLFTKPGEGPQRYPRATQLTARTPRSPPGARCSSAETRSAA